MGDARRGRIRRRGRARVGRCVVRAQIPTRPLPDFLVRIVALFDKTARVALGDLGQYQTISTERIRRVLGWKPRSLEEMIVATGESLIEHGVV